jgi:uridine kinase
MTRQDLIGALLERIGRVRLGHPTRVAIDGVDAAGKTTLADELAAPLEQIGRAVIRASIDGFHHPSAIRYRRGQSSPEGYFRDSFNMPGLAAVLLHPLGPDGDRRYRRAIFDFRLDSPVDAPVQEAPADAVLLFDGVFLHAPQLRGHWDYSIFVRADFEVTVGRAEMRDQALFGDASQVRRRYAERYVPGQQLYLAEVDPERHADVIVINHDPACPILEERRGGGRAANS